MRSVRFACGALLPTLFWLLVAAWPAVAADWAAQGVALLKARRFTPAIAVFSRAIEANPLAAEPYNNRGVCRFFTGDLDGAIADYTHALELNPAYAEAYRNRGGAWFYKKDYTRAIADYTRTLTLTADDPETYYHRGIARYYNGQYRESIADHTRALALRPQFAAASNQIAWTLAACPEKGVRNGPKAVEMALEALALSPEAIYLDTLAAAYAEAGRFEDAAAVQEKVIAWMKRNDQAGQVKDGVERLAAYRGHKPWRDQTVVGQAGQCDRERITAFIEAWRMAWQGADLRSYARCYHPDASQGDLKGKARIADHKQSLWQTGKPYRVIFESMRIRPGVQGCQVRFRQVYRNEGGYQDTGMKTVALTPYGNTYLIIDEQWRGL